jgi:hypothetical protein
MDAARKMVRELKAKEQAIKWGIVRNDKKEVTKIEKEREIEQREYYAVIRRQFLDFLSIQLHLDTQHKSVTLKEASIEMRFKRLQAVAKDRMELVERFRDDLENAKWK